MISHKEFNAAVNEVGNLYMDKYNEYIIEVIGLFITEIEEKLFGGADDETD